MDYRTEREEETKQENHEQYGDILEGRLADKEEEYNQAWDAAKDNGVTPINSDPEVQRLEGEADALQRQLDDHNGIPRLES